MGRPGVTNGHASVGQIVVLGDGLSERRAAGQVVDQVEEEPPPAGLPELSEVPALEREVRLYRSAVPFEEATEASASPGSSIP
jgi:hypothetical protein